MVFKSDTWALPANYSNQRERPASVTTVIPARQHGDIVALVRDHIERLPIIGDDVLSVNAADGRVLVRYPLNERAFDVYVGLPFTKGVTERGTGRTQLLLSTPLHHIDAMQGQFAGVWRDGETKTYGDTIRWINVGDTKTGFIGLDYNPGAAQEDGVARSVDEVRFLARTLTQFGYDGAKRLFLLKPPYVKESEDGKRLRTQGYATLDNYARRQ